MTTFVTVTFCLLAAVFGARLWIKRMTRPLAPAKRRPG